MRSTVASSAPDGIPFRFSCPAEVFEKADAEPGTHRRIGGIISTESRDRQNEVVLQAGLNLDPLLQNGWFNDNHSQKTADILGYPTRVERVTYNGKPATRVEGYLLPDYGPADEIWKLARSLQKTGRRLGFSVEGKIRRRIGPDGKVIAKADVTNVAITNCPVNTDTQLETLAKGLQVAASAPLSYWEKALTAGNAIEAPAHASPGDGFALRTESLSGGPKRRRKKRKRSNNLTRSEALQAISERFPQLDSCQVERVLRWALAQRSET